MNQQQDRFWEVLIVNNLYPPQELGGYGRSLADFANGLEQRDHRIHVLTSNASYLGMINAVEPNIDRRLQLWGTYEGQTRELQDLNQINSILQQNDRILQDVLDRINPDVCLVGNITFLGPPILGRILERNIPIIHHLGFAQAPYVLDAQPKHPLYHLATASDYVANVLRQQGFELPSMGTVYPGALVNQFRRPQLPPRDRLRIAYAGLVIESKGVHTLLEALSGLKRLGVDFECAIAGDAIHEYYYRQIQQYIQAVGIGDRIQFVGFLNREQLIEFHHRHNVLVFPSIAEEAFGITQVEAMAAGLTLITTGVGGAGEVVEHEVSGLRFSPGDSATLMQHLASLPLNPDRWAQLAATGQERAFAQFDIEHSVDRLEETFKTLLSRKAALETPPAHSPEVDTIAVMTSDTLTNPLSQSYMMWLFKRLMGAVNVYRLDHDDASTIALLRELRQQVAEFWSVVPNGVLSQTYATVAELGYRSLLTSDFQRQPLTETEETFLKGLAQQVIQGVEQPSGLKALLGAMLYYEPGKMQVRDAESRLPSWLLLDYQYVFENKHSQKNPALQARKVPDNYEEIASLVELAEGFLVPGQEKYLFEKVKSLPDDAVVVEIGSFKGRSTVAMSFACIGTQRKIYCIDTWDGNDSDFPERNFFQIWQHNLQRNDLLEYVVPLRGFSNQVLDQWQALTGGREIDLIFIDGSHQYEDVILDFQKSLPWVKSGGWLLFHDTRCGFVGVDRVWNEVAQHQLEAQEFCSTISAGRKPTGTSDALLIAPPPGAEGSTASDLSSDTVFMNRMLGCANLYYIDPEEPSIVEELRQIRRQVAEFWLGLPADRVEAAYRSEFGNRYRAMLQSGFQKEALTADETAFLQGLSQRVAAGVEQPDGLRAFLGAMLYYPPGAMQVRDAATRLPGWLLPDYRAVFEASVDAPVGDSAAAASTIAPPAAVDPTEASGAGAPGPVGLALVEDMAFLNRLLGLTNLYEIDPTDEGIVAELRQARSQVAQLWLQVPDDRLEALLGTEFGRRYGAYLKCGFQREPLTPEETELLKQLAQRVAAGLEQPAGLKAFLGAMMYYPPGKMKVSDAATRLPGWLLPIYQSVFEEGVPLPTGA